MPSSTQASVPVGTEIGLRERKKTATRLALSQAAIRLCISRGWDAVTIEDIAASADVSVRTFRNYFANKAEAIAASHVERTYRIATELRGRPEEESLLVALKACVLEQFAPEGVPAPVEQRWLDAMKLLLREPALHGEVIKANSVAQDELVSAIADRLKSSEATDLYPKVVAASVLAAVAVALEHSMFAEPPVPLKPALLEGLTLLENGMQER